MGTKGIMGTKNTKNAKRTKDANKTKKAPQSLHFSLKIRPIFLFCAFFVLLCTVFVVEVTKSYEHLPYYDTQIKASYLMKSCEEVLLDYVIEQDIVIEEEDLNKTGLIGPEFSEIATTLGHADAKRSILNPNCAAILVKYFKEAGLEEGDLIAVGTSGSFPGFAIATLCAAQAMNLKTKVIASYGASTFGATRLELNIATICKILLNSGLLDFEFLAVSPGSDNDYGKGGFDGLLYEDTRSTVVSLGQNEGIEFIDYNDIEKSIQRRLELYGQDIKLFVNVGGASSNTGTSTYTLSFPEGLVTNPPRIPTSKDRGLVFEYAARGVPVVNLLNIKKILSENDMPYDPIPLPQVGNGGVYFAFEYNKFVIYIGIFISISILIFGAVWTKKSKKAVGKL